MLKMLVYRPIIGLLGRQRAGKDRRLWDVLFMAAHAGSKAQGKSQIEYVIARVPRDGKTTEAEEVTLVLHIGPGDNGEPVITIMQRGED